MNLKNLIMWAIIVLLSVGLFNMFQDPQKIKSEQNKLPFSNFLKMKKIYYSQINFWKVNFLIKKF